MTIGWVFHLGTLGYQLAGVPLCLAFQRFVCNRSITEAWVRESKTFQLDRIGALLALALAAAPLLELVSAWATGNWTRRLFLAAAVAGAPAAAFAFRRMNREGWRCLLLCFCTAGLLGSAWTLSFCYARHDGIPFELWRLRILIDRWLLVVPLGFIAEEVAFRGVLDTHAHHPGDPRSFWSAFFISALWGWWHVPILPTNPAWLGPVTYPLTHALVGVPMCLYWRRSGNLVVPVVTHAFLDAVRDAFILV